MKARLFDSAGFESKIATKKFIKWIDKFNPDLIHIHNLHGYYINIELLFEYLKTKNYEIKWTFHDCWAFTGHCSYFDYIGCNRWENQCLDCPQKKEYPKSFFLDNSKKNYNMKKKCFCGLKNLTIITPSNWLKNLIKKSFLKEYKVEVQYNTIDTNIFKKRQSKFKEINGIKDKKIVLGVANIWEKRKGLQDLIELSKLLPEEFLVIIVGLDEQQLKSLPKNILGIKRTKNAIELAEIYSAAFVYVNTTYEDNYPTTNLEAIACGIPVLTYNTGGSVESVDKKNIVEKGDIVAIAKKIIDLSLEN